MPEPPQLLSESELAEIESRFATPPALWTDIAALTQTVRALRARVTELENERETDLIGRLGRQAADYLEANTALREQLARLENDFIGVAAARDDLESRLAQAEKELTDTRQKLTRRCSHPNTYPLTATMRRCRDCGVELFL